MNKKILHDYVTKKKELELMKREIITLRRGSEERKKLQNKYRILTRRFKRKEQQIISFIDIIDDCIVKKVMFLRYKNGLKWSEVAREMGEPYKEDTLRIMTERYIHKNGLSS